MERRGRLLLLAMALTTGCATPQAARQGSTAQAAEEERPSPLPQPHADDGYVPAFRRKPPEASPCGTPVVGAEPLLVAGGRVLLGELHGTAQVPAFVGTLACQAVHAGVPVVVALELPVEERGALAAFLASDGGEEARQGLLERAVWRRPDQDGRTSAALVELLARLRALKAEGRPVEVEPYAEPRYALQGNAREAALAENVLALHARFPEALMLVLTGNVHARRAKGSPFDAELLPMGARLSERLPGLVALDIHFAAGSAWLCKSAPGEVLPVCKAFAVSEPRRDRDRPFGLQRRTFQGRRAFIERGPGSAGEGFDGVFYVGTITASPPASLN